MYGKKGVTEYMKKRIRVILVVMLGIVSLPLLLTVFLSGKGILKSEKQWNMESILPLLMCREIPWEYEEEMKKVQAVLTRSSLYLRIEDNELSMEEWKELWRKVKEEQKKTGYQEAWKSMENAVKETKGEMLFYKGSVCRGVFHRISSGTTRDGMEVFGELEKGYLLSVNSSWDMYGEGYLSGHYFSEDSLKKQLEESCQGVVFTDEPVERQITIGEKDTAGHILELTVGGKRINGEEFRKILELPSSNFTMQTAEGTVRFLCRGQGHGMGLSQYGGNVLAKEGRSYKEILRYYFPECEVERG